MTTVELHAGKVDRSNGMLEKPRKKKLLKACDLWAKMRGDQILSLDYSRDTLLACQR